MSTTKKIAIAFTGMALCSMTLFGCSDTQVKNEEEKVPTMQEKIGQEAARTMQKPLERAREAAVLETKANQALKDAALDAVPVIQ